MNAGSPPLSTRFTSEARVLGGLCGLWLTFLVYRLLWMVITGAVDFQEMTALPAWVWISQLAAIQAVAWSLLPELPGVRWTRPGRRTRPVAWPWLLLALPAFPVAIALSVRDRKWQTVSPDTAMLEFAFHQLLRAPRRMALRFVGWCSAAALVDAIVLGSFDGWTRPEIVGFFGLQVAILVPLGTIAVGWLRTVLRPQVLSCPRQPPAFVRLRGFRLRLIVNAGLAALGIIVIPLAAVFVWTLHQPRSSPPDEAIALAEHVALLARQSREEELGALLVRDPGLSVRIGNRRFGPRYPLEGRRGPIDLDGDDQPDVVAIGSSEERVVVPIAEHRPPKISAVVVGVLAALAFTLASIIFTVLALHRDLGRATRLAAAVSEGRPPPLDRDQRYSSFEFQRLVGAVNRLVHRITEANVAKYVAIERAKEADRLKSQFLANMSHDLRSPLNSIIGFSELLISGIDGDLDAEQSEMLKTIHENGRVLLQQIDDILDMAKIEACRLDLHPEPTPPLTLLNRAIHNAKKRQHEKFDYEVDASAGLPPAIVDPYRTIQALENVLLFASQRMNGGELRIRVRSGRSARGRIVLLRVQTPIRPATKEQLAGVLRGFHRVPGHRGLGLGLPLASTILELQGGALGIEEVGKGMVFSVELCAAELRRIRETADLPRG